MSRPLSILTLALALCTGVALVVSCGSGTSAGQKEESLPVDLAPEPEVGSMFLDFGPGKEFEAQQAVIEAELANAKDHEWAGLYKTGPGLTGRTLHLAPDGRFALYEWGCTARFGYTGIAYPFSGGFDLATNYRPFNGKVHFVHWGKRRYIVPEYLMSMFIEGVNSGWVKRMGSGIFLMRSDGHNQPVDGVPELPEPYGSMIRAEPMEPRMISLRVDAGGRVLLIFDKGSADGLRTEMELRNPATGMRAEIRSVAATSCEAILDRIHSGRRDEVIATLQTPVGQKWTERVWE